MTGRAFCDIGTTLRRTRWNAGLVDSPEKFPYCFTYLANRKAQGL
jgi:hypothetical protein